ncbi:MAG: tetratricopeptide repeat protein [Planctomycetota bacterium]
MAASDNFFTKAEQALKKRNYDYAIELYQQGLQIDPDRVDERKKLRGTSIRRCQDNGSSTTGGGMLKLKQAGQISKIKRLGKKPEEQIVEIEKYLAVAPQDAKMLMNLASAFESTQRTESALQTYREIVEVEPQNKDAWKAMGRIHNEVLKDVDTAIECWEKVRSVDPSDQEAGKAIRDLSAAKMMKQTEDARAKAGDDDSFRALIKDGDEQDKLQQKQKIIRTEDDAKSAIEIKRDEVMKDAENPRQWRELGDLCLKAKKWDQAEEAYRKGIELAPNDMYLGDRLGKLQETKIANEVEELREKVKAGDASAQAGLDAAVARQNEFLLEEYARRVVAHPTDYGLKFAYGKLLQSEGNHDEAIGQFQNARKDPKFATESAYRIGKSFSAKKLYGPSINQYKEALEGVAEKESDLAKSIMYDLATAYAETKKYDTSLEILEEIMVLDITFRDVSAKVDEVRQKSEEEG